MVQQVTKVHLLLAALKDALEGCPIVDLLDHWVQSSLAKW
jgi:hypothetical protein